MKSTLFVLCLAVFVAGCGSGSKEPEAAPAAAAPATAPETALVSFAEVQPILQKNCFECHGQNGKEGIDMRTFESLMKGGEPGAIVKPGDAAGSLIVHALRGTDGIKQMPYMRTPLAEEDIAKVEAWINAGAKS